MEKIYDVVIIGGGPGGYTSALYCARAGLSTMVLEKLSAGGQMALTSQIDNYPGFEEGIDGFSLAEKMEQGAERFGAETELAEVLSVDFSNDIKIVESSEGTFKAKTVIIATGAVPRELGVREKRNWLAVVSDIVQLVTVCFTEIRLLWLSAAAILRQRMR